MGLYLPNMEMPKGGYRTVEIGFDADGHPMALADGGDVFDVIPVPPHGDLIDKKTVSQNLADVLNKKNPPFTYPDWNDAVVAMLTATTIIPAEEGEI